MGACLSSGCVDALAPDFGLRGTYKLLQRVGRGGEGEVWLGEDCATGLPFALKMIPRGVEDWQARTHAAHTRARACVPCAFACVGGCAGQHAHAHACVRAFPILDAHARSPVPIMRAQAAALSREVQCSLELGATHVNVIRPHELLLTRSHVVLATQYARGGTLASYCATHRVDELAACFFFRQFVAALAHCHAREICYRDVKLDNMLLDDCKPPNLRLCDFGVARRWSSGEGAAKAATGDAAGRGLRTVAGTPGFLSPQVLGLMFEAKGGSGYDGAAADVWSAGVVLAVMLTHRLPFGYTRIAASLDGPAAMRTAWETELRMRWRAGDPSLVSALSADALDLLDKMLEPCERTRITMDGVRSHAWFNQQLPPDMAAALAMQATAQAARASCDLECDLHGTDAAIEELCMRAQKRSGDTPGVEARLSLVPDACRRRSVRVRASLDGSRSVRASAAAAAVTLAALEDSNGAAAAPPLVEEDGAAAPA
jgi:serine/threonine-protein kinase SRK2